MVILQKHVPGIGEVALERFVRRAKRAAKLQGAVTVLITTSGELRALNRRFGRKDRATDVLSFPAIVGSGYVGDVAISAEIASENARRLGHPAADEIRILILHGLLHLAGYDHETDRGEMARKEQRLRKQLGLPVGLIERVGAGRNGTRKSVLAARKRRTARRSSSGAMCRGA